MALPIAGPTHHWTDSHCHVHDDDDVSSLLSRAAAAGVDRLICVGTNATSSQRALDVARTTTGNAAIACWATIGLHPHDASDGLAEVADLLAASLSRGDPPPRGPGSVVAVGECGLDYHYEHSPRVVQNEVFAAQIALAKQSELALVVHSRDAWDDTVAMLAGHGAPERTVIHCFTGGADEARRCLDLGAYLSFSGIVSFKNAENVRDAARLCPQDRLLVETDAPYLAPVPHRGQPNEPAYVTLVGQVLAALRDVDPAHLAEQTSANAEIVFSLRR